MSGGTERDVRVEIGLFGWLNRLMLSLIVLSIIALIILKYLPLIRKNESMSRELQSRREEVQALEVQVNRNQARIEALRSDPRTVEREAREKLGMARPDEHVVTFQNGSEK
jgi:cell division protein FtsB